MNENELKLRSKKFALRVMKLVEALPKTTAGRAIGNQLMRSGTSVGANYRAACRGRSKPEFIAKIGIVEEEADESAFWMELIIEGGLMKESMVNSLLKGNCSSCHCEERFLRRSREASQSTLKDCFAPLAMTRG